MFRFCLGRLRSREEAEDARQTTFLYACRALRRGVVPVSESSWLLKIAENVCKSRHRDARRRFAVEVAEDPETLQRAPAPAGDGVELLMPLQEALGRLTEQQRQALLLREWRGLSYSEIAGELGIGRGAVEALLFRARRTLAEELEAPGAKRRRAARALDLGWLAGAAKSLFGGGATAVKAAAAAAIVVTAAVSTLTVALPRDSDAPPARPAGAPWLPARADVPAPRTARPEAGPETRAPALPSAPERPSAAPRETPAHAPSAPGPGPAPERPAAPSAPKAAEDPVAAAVASVTEPVAATLEPVVGAATGALEPIAATAGAAAEDVNGTVGEVAATTGDAVEPVTSAVEDALGSEPLLP